MIDFRQDIDSILSDKFPDLKIEPSTLYVTSTPIGNLEDISFRALFILKNVDFIAAEDTRTTGSLLHHYNFKNRLISYHSHSGDNKLEHIISELKSGKSAALVSDAGTPGISDPGGMLVSKCYEEDINITPVPGSSAFMHALVISGYDSNRFFFQGFLPQKKGRNKTFEELKKKKMAIVLYESPYRIMRTLKDINDFMGNIEVTVSRELTKKFEDHKRGRVKDFLNGKIQLKIKGEFVITLNNI